VQEKHGERAIGNRHAVSTEGSDKRRFMQELLINAQKRLSTPTFRVSGIPAQSRNSRVISCDKWTA
jgi:hypothetical protein